MGYVATKGLRTSAGVFRTGETLPDDLPDDEFDRLVKIGAVGEAKAKAVATRQAPSTSPADPVTFDDPREQAIATVIAGLGENEFTKGGLPDLSAINKRLAEGAEPVTATERDKVWAALSAEEQS
ncbi:hypothetical protein SAMN05444339_10270 [Loktanella atrilutea]|uniref:Uncharacterized protein n=1 Tax=Loktanella atrilutea TaxID=366533 RepID=A0A1M4WCT0_LOKAT|nr:hypothetical protein [Loktanella atrilutea]SHE79034.1 hypothetical protein SAMN05444339_10270 [Loktanella atrilutea]